MQLTPSQTLMGILWHMDVLSVLFVQGQMMRQYEGGESEGEQGVGERREKRGEDRACLL